MGARKAKPGLCGTCHREVPLRRDGRLRAHLAEGSGYGKRQTCDGSGAYSARVQMQGGAEPAARDLGGSRLSAAEVFNANAEWSKANALYWELEDMRDAGAATPEMLKSAEDAVRRAARDARRLAQFGPVWQDAGGGDAV